MGSLCDGTGLPAAASGSTGCLSEYSKLSEVNEQLENVSSVLAKARGEHQALKELKRAVI